MNTLHTYLIGLTKLALFCLSILLVPCFSHAGDASFTWTANAEPLTGYKLYYETGEINAPPYEGTGLNEGDSPILLNKVTTFMVTNLSPNKFYQFAITAYNEGGESGYSEIVQIQPVEFPIPAISIMSQN